FYVRVPNGHTNPVVVDIPAASVLNTLSLHDALPISQRLRQSIAGRSGRDAFGRPSVTGNETSIAARTVADRRRPPGTECPRPSRSEEHTSELQSRENLVCRLLLEKKKNIRNN